MKTFKIESDVYYYGVAANSEEEAKKIFTDTIGDSIDYIEEIPEKEWDEKTINVWEDNDMEKEPFKVSIREVMGEGASVLFSNDPYMID